MEVTDKEISSIVLCNAISANFRSQASVTQARANEN